MLRPIRKNRFSVNSQNLLYTIFCESIVYTLAQCNDQRILKLVSLKSDNYEYEFKEQNRLHLPVECIFIDHLFYNLKVTFNG